MSQRPSLGFGFGFGSLRLLVGDLGADRFVSSLIWVTREAFYVAMIRGRYVNHAHVITGPQPDTDQPNTTNPAGTQAVLEQILANTGQQLSAHDTRDQLEHQAQQWISRCEADTGARLAERDSRSGPAHFARQRAPRPSEHAARRFSGYSRRDTRQQPPSRGVAR